MSQLRMCVGHCTSPCICNPLSHRPQLKGCCGIDSTGILLRNIRSRVVKVKQFSILGHHLRQLRPSPFCSLGNVDSSMFTAALQRIEVSVSLSSYTVEGSTEKNEKGQTESFTSTEILKRLKRYGISGILSYGLLNTVYYLMAFLLVWFYVAPAPGRMGYLAAVERFLKVMAMVWAGSQVTKLLRAAGALALAPFVDKGLSWFTANFKFESRGKAFLAIVGFCLGLAVMLFLIVTLLWA